MTSLTSFFSPRGIAVIGATSDPTKLGYGLARNLLQCKYQGAVHFVNPRGGNLFGQTVYPSILSVPDPLDLAVLLIPAGGVAQVLVECGRRGVNAAIVCSGGFREIGPEGAALEADILHVAREQGLRLLGPNCIGLLDTHLPLDTTFLPPPGPPPGDVAFISHSGAICAAVIDWARGQGFGMSRLVSLGNQADLNETDMLEPVAADPYTRVIALYMEGVSNGRRFVEAAGRVTPRKPVIALKVGRFAGGQRAAASHTGALAGQETAFNAAFRRAGVIRADTSEELFGWARALAWCPPPQGRLMAVLTNAGGPGVTAADALEGHGLPLASLSPETQQKLKAVLPPVASLYNPVDMLASATPQQYASSLEILLADPGIHGVLVVLVPPPMQTTGAVARAIIPVIQGASKPVVIALMGEMLIQEAVEHFRAARVPEYRFPERAATALATLAQRAEFLQRLDRGTGEPRVLDGLDRALASRLIADAAPGPLPPDTVDRLLKAYGILALPQGLALTPDEAARLAVQIGFPVVLKVVSADILHKSDVGGVMLNLQDADSVASACRTLLENVSRLRPNAIIDGVQVQRMAPVGQDVIIGVVRDAQFGPLLMFGSGGVEVEGLKDVAFSLAPPHQEEIDFMLETTWAGRKLAGFRSLPPADIQALARVLQHLGQLASDFPMLAEIEINPLRVLPAGKGVLALDARARLCQDGETP